MWNLIANAIKFSNESSIIEVSLQRAGANVALEVKDFGEGIGADFLPFVFDRFSQQDGSMTRKHGGLGLGLSIIKHLTELHSGTVRVESAGRGQGASFKVFLAALDEADERLYLSKSTTRNAHSVPLGSLAADATFLVVDDQRDNRLLLKAILRSMGAKILEADSAAAAYLLLQSTHVDAMICDISMPEETGLQFIDRLRTDPRHLKLPAAALSAYASDHDREMALAAGFDMYLSKPVKVHELANVVSHLRELARVGTTGDLQLLNSEQSTGSSS